MRVLILLASSLLLALTACGGGGSSPKVTPLTVTGKVLDHSGQPGAFLPVIVGGKVTASDASGNFSMAGVTSPYELVVLQPAQKYAQVYEGVTRTDPIMLVYQNNNATARQARLKMNFTGVGTGEGLADFANPLNINGGVTGSVATPGTSYTDTYNWNGPSSFQGNVCAILYQKTNGVATAINAFGEQDNVNIQDGQTSTTNVNMAAVPTKTLSGTVTVPTGFTLSSKTLGFLCGSNVAHVSYPFTFDMSSTPTFSYAIPVTLNTLYLGATATSSGANLYIQQLGVAPDASGVSLVLPQPVVPIAPTNNALGIAAAAGFSWSPTTLGLSQVSFSPVSPGPLSITVYTSSASLTLPDLSALGYPLPKGTTYKWSVWATSNTKTLDDVLSGVPLNNLTSYSSSSSANWQFTTAP